MTNHDTDTPSDELLAYWEDDYPEAEWYCNHDVPNGCQDCAWLRREDEMIAAMTPDERGEYFAAQDERYDRDVRI